MSSLYFIMYYAGFFLSIAMASNGMVARALVRMTDLYTGLVELLDRRPSSYWFVLNSQGKPGFFLLSNFGWVLIIL